MIYIFDVDGTVLTSVPHSRYADAKPIPGRIERVNQLYDAGHTIVYWTARGAQSGGDWYEFTLQQLKSFGCKFHHFYTRKPHYNVWVDDKAQNADQFFD